MMEEMGRRRSINPSVFREVLEYYRILGAKSRPSQSQSASVTPASAHAGAIRVKPRILTFEIRVTHYRPRVEAPISRLAKKRNRASGTQAEEGPGYLRHRHAGGPRSRHDSALAVQRAARHPSAGCTFPPPKSGRRPSEKFSVHSC